MLSTQKIQKELESSPYALLVSDIKKSIMDYVAEVTKKKFSKKFIYNLTAINRRKFSEYRKQDIAAIDAMMLKYKKPEHLISDVSDYLMTIKTSFTVQCVGFLTGSKSRFKEKINAALKKHANIKNAMVDEKSTHALFNKENKLHDVTEKLLELLEKEKQRNDKLQEELSGALAKIKRLEGYMTKKQAVKKLKEVKVDATDVVPLDEKRNESAVQKASFSNAAWV